ncbi:MAG TPA: FAD-dependent oxidoreductase [Drouetiella sp.]
MVATVVDPYMQEAFPLLTEEEMESLKPYASCEHYEDDELVFTSGQPDIDMFVIREGMLEIINTHDGDEVLYQHEPGSFSGDIDLLTRRPVNVSAKARGKTYLMRIRNEQLREVLQKMPHISEILLNAFQLRRSILEKSSKLGLKVIGYPTCSDTTTVREFLHKNFVPFVFYDVTTEEGKRVQTALGAPDTYPSVECRDGTLLVRPTLNDIARGAGIWRHCPAGPVDLLVIGAGPAGITSAVYAASEGLSTLVVDRLGPGGQAGGSSKIENFIGFPCGLSGTELSTRGILQMLKFGAQLAAPVSVKKLSRSKDGTKIDVMMDCGSVVQTRVALISAGVQWKKLAAKNAYKYERAGVYYACTSVEALLHDHQDVAVVGGGNSAGQAAMYLANCCPTRRVHLIVRGTLGPSMSEYLHTRIMAEKNIDIYEGTEITEVHGDMNIRTMTIHSKEKGTFDLPAAAVFVFIGSEPAHPWIPEEIARDDRGFLLTGADALNSGLWPLKDRVPCQLETSMPGVLAAGDVRSGTTKRVGFAVGDGSLAVSCVHNLLTIATPQVV